MLASIEERIKSQLGGMVLQILTQQMQIEQLQAANQALQAMVPASESQPEKSSE